eukprot:TRINITY_DN112564_c0_g1_i1.p1 TRINITY_DN112564_c0_g1~~TRINITY_DN112564_c0_g1_i1.p1  ORF type:complete len:647 (-),score=74.64 TRINITY_DN112564_c0_g1_i1:65-2005(-)
MSVSTNQLPEYNLHELLRLENMLQTTYLRTETEQHSSSSSSAAISPSVDTSSSSTHHNPQDRGQVLLEVTIHLRADLTHDLVVCVGDDIADLARGVVQQYSLEQTAVEPLRQYIESSLAQFYASMQPTTQPVPTSTPTPLEAVAEEQCGAVECPPSPTTATQHDAENLHSSPHSTTSGSTTQPQHAPQEQQSSPAEQQAAALETEQATADELQCDSPSASPPGSPCRHCRRSCCRRQSEEELHDDECTWVPCINSHSKELVRSTSMGSVFNRLHSMGMQQKKRKETEAEHHSQRELAKYFQPKHNTKSPTAKQVNNQRGPHYRGAPCANYGVMLYKESKHKREQKKKENERAKREAEQDEIKEATFQPTISALAKKLFTQPKFSNQGLRTAHIGGGETEKPSVEKELELCTFKPSVDTKSARMVSQAGRRQAPFHDLYEDACDRSVRQQNRKMQQQVYETLNLHTVWEQHQHEQMHKTTPDSHHPHSRTHSHTNTPTPPPHPHPHHEYHHNEHDEETSPEPNTSLLGGSIGEQSESQWSHHSGTTTGSSPYIGRVNQNNSNLMLHPRPFLVGSKPLQPSYQDAVELAAKPNPQTFAHIARPLCMYEFADTESVVSKLYKKNRPPPRQKVETPHYPGQASHESPFHY